MNIVYLIGNGFDLNLGMKTKYTDFYKYYLHLPQDNDSEAIKRFKKNLETDSDMWSDLESALGTKYLRKINEKDAVDIHKHITTHLPNYLVEEESRHTIKESQEKFFKYLSEPQVGNWLLSTETEEIEKYTSTYRQEIYNIKIITFNYTKSIEKILGFDIDQPIQKEIRTERYNEVLRTQSPSQLSPRSKGNDSLWHNGFIPTKDQEESYLRAYHKEDTDIDQAIKDYIANTKVFPKDPRNFVRLGTIYERKDETLELAVLNLNKAVKLIDNDPRVWLLLARVNGRLNKIGEELFAYKKYIQLNPKDLTARRRIGKPKPPSVPPRSAVSGGRSISVSAGRLKNKFDFIRPRILI